MSLYHSVTVNSDSEPVIVEVSNISWKNAHYQRERRKKTIGFLFSLLVISGCVAFFWTHKDQWRTRESKKIVRSKLYLEDFTTPTCTVNLRVVGYCSLASSRAITEIQVSKLTHIIFSHLVIQSDGSISFRNENEKTRFFDLNSKVKNWNSNVKMMISIEEHGVNFDFSKVAENAKKRKKFIDSVSSFLLEHHLDGVDINWKYPYNEHLPSQVTLISELREHLDITSTQKNSRPYLISLVAPALGRTLENAIGKNLKNLHVNFVNVKSFDYWKFWRNTTGPSTPLFSGVEKPSVNDTISYYIKTSGTPEKLNLGLAFHGTYWNNVYKEHDSLSIWKPVDTKKGYMERGQVAWRDMEKEGWIKSSESRDKESRTTYIYDAGKKKLLSFDNPRSLKEKVEYAVDRMVGGLTISSMEMDDDKGKLLGAVSSKLCDNL